MVEDLNHLQKGGRISKTAAVIGTMVQIKPIICLDNEGKLQIIRKERGRKKGMNKIVDMAVEACEGKMPDMVMIPHGNCPEDAAYVIKNVPEIDGFFGASSIERLASERGMTAQAAAFKAIEK